MARDRHIRLVSRLLWGALVVLPLACATDDTNTPGTEASGPGTENPDPGPGLNGEELTETEQVFKTEMAAQLALAEKTTSAELVAAFPPSSTAVGVSYDPTAAAHFDLIESTLELTESEVGFIAEHGFGVIPRHEFRTAHDAYYRIYVKDLPVYITADSVLFSLHRSFNTALKYLEQGALTERLDAFLALTHAELAKLDVDPALADAHADLDEYLAVARSLLAGQTVAPMVGQLSHVEEILGMVDKLALRPASLFGADRMTDFSQFEPRGHYTESEELKRYFRAMMWLGRIDLRFREYDAYAQEWIWHDRQIRASWLLHRAIQGSGSFEHWNAVHSIIGALVGEVDAMDLHAYTQFTKDAQLESDEQLAGDMKSVHDVLVSGGYGRQRIRSHYLSTNRFTEEITPLNMSFAVLGQRFTPDSYVFSKVVHDEVTNRRLPSPFDALFALGSNDALAEVAAEVQMHDGPEGNPYAKNLHMLRWVFDGYTDDFWGSAVYYLWVDALRALNDVPVEAPEVAHTQRFRHRLFNTQLASWAELRHDTLLYAKQSYTGSEGCDYPAAYVEPVPEFWARVETVGARLSQAITEAKLDGYTAEWVKGWADNWTQVTGTLRSISEKQLSDKPLDAAEQELLDTWISIPDSGVCGGPAFNGVFTTLLLDISELSDAKYTIADVHTNPGGQTTDPAAVLHVGTGPHQLMVVTRDSCDGVQSYVGVVGSFYEHEQLGVDRLTNEEWREMLASDNPPQRPAFASSFLAP